MFRHTWMVAILLAAAACRTDKGDEDTGEVEPGPDDDTGEPDSGEVDDTSTPPDDTGESGWMKSNCEYETPPTVFTGGLVYLAYTWPDGGEFSVEFDDYYITDETGTVDWDAGTLESVTSYVDDYTTVSAETTMSFELDGMGDYTASTSTLTTQLNGDTGAFDSTTTKTDCVWVTESYDKDSGETTTVTTELVSADRFEFEQVVTNDGGTGWTYYGTGVRSEDDWSNAYSFQTDDPDTEVTPDRAGSCTVSREGTSTCEMELWWDSGKYQTDINVWAYNGDWSDEWAQYWLPDDEDPFSWGIRSGEYWGSGEATWWEAQDKGDPVECHGSWDTDGVGTWSCDNGAEGTYP